MAILELSPLGDHLEETELSLLREKLADLEAEPLEIDAEGESIVLSRDIEDDVLAEVQDLLDANNAASELYLPTDFEDTFEIDGMRVGSATTLLNALEELREEISIEDDSESELEDDESLEPSEYDNDESGFDSDDDVDRTELKNAQLQHIWKLLYSGAKQCIEKNVGLFVHS